MRMGSLDFATTDMVTRLCRTRIPDSNCGERKRERVCGTDVGPTSGPASNAIVQTLKPTIIYCSVMNSPLEPASPASSSSESLTDDISMTQEYPATERADRSVFGPGHASTKGVAKRRLPGRSTKTTGNRDSKARRREENSHGKGGPPDRRDPTKGKNDLLDVALFEALRKSMPL